MIQTNSVSFAWTPATAVIAVAAVVATALLGLVACRRSGWRGSTVALEALRLLMVSIAALLLGGPEWVEQYRPEEKPVVAVLWDDSGSMQTRDASMSAASRSDAIEPLTQVESWQSLQGRAEVVIESFAETKSADDSTARVNPISANPEQSIDEPGTDLSSPLVDAATKHDNLLGVVLASDGDWNQGSAPVQAAGRLRSLGIPVFVFPVGSDTQLPDVELLSFDVPTFAIAGKRVRIPFSIESSLPRDHQATVTMKTNEGETITKEVRVQAMGRTNSSIDWEPEALGETSLTLSVSPTTGEVRDDNNEMTSPISIREEKLRVLVIESVPRWEYRYLRNALSRDPGVDVSCLLFHPGLDKHGGGNADYISEFPATKAELSKYDVVFIGDVGIDDGQLTIEQCEWLRGLVGQQASGIVFMPGWQGREFSLLDTPLGELIPVVMDEGQPRGWGSRTAQHFELTELGRRSLLTKLADTTDENLEVWGNLPGFQWYAPVVRAKPGTETLCVHQEISNQFGRLPLLVTRTFGGGKVLFMGTDGAWRWRKGVEDLYHYRFWGQVVRWMAYRRSMTSGENMYLYQSPERPRVRQTVTVNANVMESSGEPLSKGDVTLRVVSPAGRIETIRLDSVGEEWGAFSGRFTPHEHGMHELTLFCKQTGDTLQTKLLIQGASLEQVGKPARPEVLEEIARVTRGQILTVDRLDDVVQWLAAMPDPPPSVRRIALWSHPFVVGLFFVLLALFWIARKGVGLI
ncbi:vWA domain-containing protein [Allorhodopirellula heiligendammensis]|uniref:Rhodanese domain-containing protein n=1 Tax=Allorhodopirellula heiligendammensis TaxID=2714739 RepID=A0A5C6C2N9_9BACT|nr:vWA domain-containing protein [Allorhodopirellula heiligendammensis]TWU17921.1 hypothetical protein Poly21_00730 [Allorhodopirellula heiligendammensis]